MPAYIWICIGMMIGLYGPPLGAWLLDSSERRARRRRIPRMNVDEIFESLTCDAEEDKVNPKRTGH